MDKVNRRLAPCDMFERKICKQYAAEDKIRIVPDGLKGEESIASCVVARASLRASITAVGRGIS